MPGSTLDGHRRPAVEARGLTKVFPPAVVALDEVTVAIEAGEIHAVVGENGAGKTTLMKIFAGELAPDAGTVAVDGLPRRFASARDAIAAGVGLVHQEILLVDAFTVWENVVLGVEPVGRAGAIDHRAARRTVRDTIERAGFRIDVDARAGDLSVAARQQVEITKLLHRDVRTLILDEPTASLTPQEVPELFAELRRMRDGGRTVVFISHRLGEVLQLADRVTVLRDGRLVATVPAAGTSRADLARLMVDRDVLLTSRRTVSTPGRRVLSMRGASAGRLRPIDLDVRAGEIVGVAGLDDAGQRDLVDLVVGLVPSPPGTVTIEGTDVSAQTIGERRRALAAVPSERKLAGGAVGAPILDTTRMAHHRLTPGFAAMRGWWQRHGRAVEFCDEVRSRHDVVSSGPTQLLGSLSGGNQQKVVLGRELAFGRRLLVLDQPTRGVDVGSIEALHAEILAQRAEGTAVLLVSADLEELFLLADRLVVLHRGELALSGPTEDLTMSDVGAAMLNGPPVVVSPGSGGPS
jgi:simple sugar transport system ATP-binding protein